MPAIPLFPLHTVLFPGGPLRLRIFEARYVDMIGRCMRAGSGFGVAMIVEGREAGGAARTASIGTLARIVDFEQLKDGLLGITALGERRFRIVGTRTQTDGLNIADIVWPDAEPMVAVPERYEVLVQALRQAFPQLAAMYGAMEPDYGNAGWVGARLVEILELRDSEKQSCLEMDDPLERLEYLRGRLDISA